MKIDWDELLLWIEEKHVIPIIGQDLLMVERNNRTAPLYTILAEVLAAEFAVDPQSLERSLRLSDLYKPSLAKKQKLHSKLKLVYDRLVPSLTIPAALLDLARITHLKLFVTTTFDNLLERALNQERFAGAEKTLTVAFSPNDTHLDLTPDALSSGNTIVFQLLGRISSSANYAITEGELVEFMHSLQSKGPVRLFDALKANDLLLLGNSFPPWFWRFFLRTAKNEILWVPRSKSELLVDSEVGLDQPLKEFIDCYSGETMLVDDFGPVEFAAQLYAEWYKRHGKVTPVEPAHEGNDPLAMRSGSIFISYASGDRPAVEALRNSLEGAGLDVWFDRDELRGGDAWEEKIHKNILKCSLFMPVISETILRRDEGNEYFREEWHWALARLPKYTGLDRPFIVPVVIDDTQLEGASGIPREFFAFQAVATPKGEASRKFISHLVTVIRDIRLKEQGVS